MSQQEELIEREFLCGKRVRTKKNLNMEKIYQDFDNGMSWEAVCKKYDASESTIRRRHKEYQEQVKALKKQQGQFDKDLGIIRELEAAGINYVLPPLPTDI